MLKLAGYINLLISLLHFAALFNPGAAFRLTGISESMARAASISPSLPLILTAFVAFVFAGFGIYALTGAGTIHWRLPLIKPVIYIIGIIYFLRGILGLIQEYTEQIPALLQTLFSLTALGIGVMFIIGGMAYSVATER